MEHTREILTPRQTRAVLALLSAKTLEDAARAAGVSSSTLRRWMQQALFMDAYQAARQSLVDHAVARLQASAEIAAETLRAVMEDPDSSASSKVAAAKAVLDIAMGLGGGTDDDLLDRLDAIEQHVRRMYG